jgi:uncharacterized protein
MPFLKCPVCGVAFDPQRSKCVPFCNERCRLIDLKRWLGEEYAVPGPPADPDEEDERPSDDSSDDDDS